MRVLSIVRGDTQSYRHLVCLSLSVTRYNYNSLHLQRVGRRGQTSCLILSIFVHDLIIRKNLVSASGSLPAFLFLVQNTLQHKTGYFHDLIKILLYVFIYLHFFIMLYSSCCILLETDVYVVVCFVRLATSQILEPWNLFWNWVENNYFLAGWLLSVKSCNFYLRCRHLYIELFIKVLQTTKRYSICKSVSDLYMIIQSPAKSKVFTAYLFLRFLSRFVFSSSFT
jgi:hypothetical protein